jgi:hypothetical protein
MRTFRMRPMPVVGDAEGRARKQPSVGSWAAMVPDKKRSCCREAADRDRKAEGCHRSKSLPIASHAERSFSVDTIRNEALKVSVLPVTISIVRT